MEEDYMIMSSEEDDHNSNDEASFGADGIEHGLQFHTTRQSYKVINKESFLAAQKEDLLRIMDLLKLTEQHARTLLIHHKWEIDKVLSVLVEKGKDRLFVEAGVRVDARKMLVSLCSPPIIITCYICMEDVPSDKVTTMDCGHFFCNNCWTEHFIVKINEGKRRCVKCMVHMCNTVCDEEIVRNLLSTRDYKLAERFDRFLLESYIEDNKMVKWCPSVPHCGNAIRVEDGVSCEVECSCGLQFCFSCLSNVHSPCSCLMWNLWTKKDESETVDWLGAYTKPCPKCIRPIEKSGGCNLMTCICGQPFCWLCGEATGKHHSIARHTCGRYKEVQEKKDESAKPLSINFSRYMHYYMRYKAHKDSFKLEMNLEAFIQYKVSILPVRNPTCSDFSWVTNGLHGLLRARRVLMYSYPFSYYMFGDELFKDEMTKEERELKHNLFDDQQQQLEVNAEKLSKLMEAPISEFSEDVFKEKRMETINLSSLVDRQCKSMYECIENDLLGSLQLDIHNIAPYHSDRLEKAIQPSVWMQTHYFN